MRRGLKVVVLAVLAGAMGMAGIAEANDDTGDTVVLAGGTCTGVTLTLNASMSLSTLRQRRNRYRAVGVNDDDQLGSHRKRQHRR
jgi:hypothetical protein